MIPKNKNVRQLVWDFQYAGIAVKDRELYCYSTDGNRNSVVSQASCRMAVTQLEHEMSKFIHGQAGGIRRLPHRWQRTVEGFGDYFEGP